MPLPINGAACSETTKPLVPLSVFAAKPRVDHTTPPLPSEAICMPPIKGRHWVKRLAGVKLSPYT